MLQTKKALRTKCVGLFSRFYFSIEQKYTAKRMLIPFFYAAPFELIKAFKGKK